MNVAVSKPLLCVVALLSAGCATSQVHWDSTKMREHALDYYSDEIIDNLIRASNGLVFIHVDVSQLTANVQSKIAGNIGGGQTLTRTSTKGATAVLSSMVQTAFRPITFTIAPERSDTLISDAKPEVNDPEVYKPYLQFLKLQDPQQRLQSITNFDLKLDRQIQSIRMRKEGERLTEGVDYIPGTLKEWHGREYYIPCEYKQAYFDLCLALIGRIKAGGAPVAVAPRSARTPSASTKPIKPASITPTAPAGFIPTKDSSRELRQLELNEDKLNQLRSMQPQ